jgi:hypothetical protein
MISKKRLWGVGLAVAMLARPALSQSINSDVKPSSEAVYFVLGIQPVTARMEIDEPLLKSGSIWSFRYNMSSYHPVDGFIVVKGKPNTAYGIGASSLMLGKSVFGARYKPCGQVPLFQAEAGKVVYVTTIAYRSEGVKSYGPLIDMAESASYSQDMDGAREFLKAHYPGLSDSLEQGKYEMMPVAHKCA